MNLQWQAAWVAVTQNPLFALAITMGSYKLAIALYEKTRWPLLQPVLISMLMVIAILYVFDLSYTRYLQDTAPLTLLLGPVIVALAVPLYINLRHIRRLWQATLLTLLIGGVFATLLGVALTWLFGASHVIQLSMLSKSVTSPIAISLSTELGGIPALAAIFTLVTGIIGAMLGPEILHRIGVTHPAAQGMALGLTSHAVGTARAAQISEECAGFSALAMSLMGISTAIILPIVVSLLS